MLGVIDTYQKLLNGQIKGFEGQWSRVPGNKDKDFYKTFGLGEKPGETNAPSGSDDLAAKRAKAKEMGYTDEEIDAYLKGKK